MLSDSSNLQHLKSQGSPTASLPCPSSYPAHAAPCRGKPVGPATPAAARSTRRARRLPAGRTIGKSVSPSARYDTGSSEAAGKYEGQGRLRSE